MVHGGDDGGGADGDDGGGDDDDGIDDDGTDGDDICFIVTALNTFQHKPKHTYKTII